MQNNAYIFFGRSGSGKGTQAKLLQEHLKLKNKKVVYIETGQAFRDFINGDAHSQKLSKIIMDKGELQPQFLAVWIWAGELIEKLQGDEDVIFDGTPRRLTEAQLLNTALSFYGLAPHNIYLHIDHDEAVRRLLARGREDDKKLEGIEERLKWFQDEVVPALEYYKKEPSHKFFTIDGVGSVETIQNSILESLKI